MGQFILAVMMTVAVGAEAKERKIVIPEGSSEATERLILNLKPGEVDPAIWRKLGTYKQGGDPKLIYVLEAAIISAGVKNYSKIEDELITVIDSGKATDDGKRSACRLLQRVGSDKCVPALSKLLLDEEMSHFARLALESFPAVNALRNALPKAPDTLKPGIIGSLGNVGSGEDVPSLSKYAADKDTAIAGSAIQALADIGTAEALKALKALKPAESLENGHRDALISAALQKRDVSVLKKMYSDTTGINRTAALRGWLRIEEDSAVAEVSRIVTSQDEELLTGALQIITMEPSSKLTSELASKVATIKDKATQLELISALGTRGDISALKTISALAGSSDRDIANTALAALGELHSPDSIELLLRRMKSPYHAAAAKKALAAISAAGTDAALISSLADRDVAVQILNVLAERMTFSAAPAIIRLLNDEDEEIRKAAWSAVPEVCAASDTEMIMSILLKLKDELEVSRAARSVVVLASNVEDRKACFNAALKFNENASEPVRDLILDLGAIVGTPEALDMVMAAYASDDKELKAKALRVLCTWSTVNAAPTLIDLAEHGGDDVTRILALRGYIRLADLEWRELVDDKHNFDAGMDKKYQMLLSASKLATRKEERTSIISALGDMGHTKRMQEVELVMTYVDDPEVKAEAELAAVNLAKRLAKHKPAEVLPIARKLYETTESKHVKFHANKAIETCKSGEGSERK